MKATPLPEAPAVAAWDHVMHIEESISPTAARALLKVTFTPVDVERMQELATKAREGTLSNSDKLEIDTFERLGCLLDILHSKSRRALERAKVKA